MMPHQSQAACMAIEDAAALGILFSRKYFHGDVPGIVALYNAIRLPRATKVQAAAARASSNINERIGKCMSQPGTYFKLAQALIFAYLSSRLLQQCRQPSL